MDEVHRLPPEGQEILFYLMDKGKFRRLGRDRGTAGKSSDDYCSNNGRSKKLPASYIQETYSHDD